MYLFVNKSGWLKLIIQPETDDERRLLEKLIIRLLDEKYYSFLMHDGNLEIKLRDE